MNPERAPKQLIRFARQNFSMFSVFIGNSAETVNAARFPQVFWPSGEWCLPVNLYLLDLFFKKYSIRGKGGTLATYAFQLSPLIRHCYDNELDFHELDDANFRLAIRSLSAKVYRHSTVVAKNNSTSIVKIGRVWLDFLNFVGQFRRDSELLGESGRVRGYQVKKSVALADGRVTTSLVWHHSCFPDEDPAELRMPISDSTVKELINAAETLNVDPYIRSRRVAMLEFLYVTGARRMECILLKRESVISAIYELRKAREENNPTFIPMLKFQRVKNKGNEIRYREVPISPISLELFDTFLQTSTMHFSQLGIKLKRRSPVFANARSGQELMPNSVTQEFHALAKAAGIPQDAFPHLVRHRFILSEFVRLLLAHKLSSKDDFDRLIVDSNSFMRQVREVTGHASTASLEVYLQFAFQEIAGMAQTVDRARLIAYQDALSREHSRYEAAMKRGEDAGEAGKRLSRAFAEVERQYRLTDLPRP
ncbi:tyrosine-type recombinase/integrase (plasmid) [Paraburkholderia strydomiana]